MSYPYSRYGAAAAQEAAAAAAASAEEIRSDAGSLGVASDSSGDVRELSRWVGGVEHAYSDDVYDVLFVYGQSNALGKAALGGDTSGFPSPGPKSLMWELGAGEITPITQAYSSWSGGSDSTSSGHAWCSFANEWYRLTGRGVIVVPGAEGGKTIAQLSKGAGTGYYEGAVSGMASLDSAASGLGISLGKKFCLFHQGESDQSAGTSWADYRDALESLVGDIIADTGCEKVGVFTVGCPLNRDESSWQVIQNAQSYVASTVREVFVPFGGCGQFNQDQGMLGVDGVHYTQRAYNDMGRYAAQASVSPLLGSSDTLSQPEVVRYGRLNGQAWSDSSRVSGFLYYNGGWKVRSKDAGGGLMRSSNIKSVTTNGERIRVELSAQCSSVTALQVTTTSTSSNNAGYTVTAKPIITQGDDTTYIDIYAFSDLTVGVNTSTGAIFNGTPLSSSSPSGLYGSVFSVSTDGLTATLTHPQIRDQPVASIYPDSTISEVEASVFCRAKSSTSTIVSVRKNDGSGSAVPASNPVACVAFRNILIPPDVMGTLGGLIIAISGEFSML